MESRAQGLYSEDVIKVSISSSEELGMEEARSNHGVTIPNALIIALSQGLGIFTLLH